MRLQTEKKRKRRRRPGLAGALIIALLPAAAALRSVGAPETGEARSSSQLRLPCGPEGPGRFGAYPTTLKYDPAWDKPWPVSEAADVVVRFDQYDQRFVFWRGTSYVPCWATYNSAWFCNEFFERRGGAASGTTSMVEPMSDKKTRYSHVRIIENTDARVVVHWRYAPADLEYGQAYVDQQTRWGDWADEFYTIYPDSVGVRQATLHTSALDDWIEYQESIVINQPGTIPEDNLDFAALTLANLKGESRNYTWTENGGPKLSGTPVGACIQVVNFKCRFKPFTIINPDRASVSSYGGHAPGSHFNFWNHWPVSQEKSDTTVAKSAARPSHTSLSQLKWRPYAEDAKSRTWIHLHGMTDQPAATLATLARSWLYAPELKVGRGDYSSEGYDPSQRAYVLKCKRPGQPSVTEIELVGAPERPVVNPCLVIHNWGNAEVALQLNGQEVPRGKDFRFGHCDSLEGRALIVWVKTETTASARMQLAPVPKRAF